MKAIAQAIIDEGLDITWSGYARAEISRETLELFKKSDGRTLHVGYESRNERTLEIIKKGVTVERMEQFAKDIQDLDLWTCAGFMIFPFETKNEVRNTIRWAKNVIRPKRFSFTQLFPYPNTPICETLRLAKGGSLSQEEMTELEKEGFKEFYLRNKWWWWETLKDWRQYPQVATDAWGLLRFLWG